MGKQKVKRISVYNLGKVKVGELTFREDSPIAELSSNRKNAQGKTSFITGLEFISKGKRGLGQNPVHDDAKKARVEVELTDLLIVSEITHNGTASRRVIPKEGSGIVGNEEFIDRIFKGVELDPEGFKKLSRLEKFRFAMQLAGCQDELDRIDAKRKLVYAQRTLANSRRDDSQTQLDGMTRPIDGLPEEEIPASALTDELRRINGLGIKKNAAQGKVERLKADLVRKFDVEKNEARAKLNLANDRVSTCNSNIVSQEGKVDRLERELREATDELSGLKNTLARLQNSAKDSQSEYDAINVDEIDFTADPAIVEAQAEYDAIVVPPSAEIEAKIESNEAANAEIRAAKAYREKKAENDRNKTEAEAKDNEYKDLGDDKIKIVKSSAIQIPGLELNFQSETLMYNGRDIDSASYAESLLIAAEMIIDTNQDCPFFVIQNASSIGDEIRQRMVEMCLAKGAQGIFESISESSLPGLIFVDGVGEVYEGKSEVHNDLFGGQV